MTGNWQAARDVRLVLPETGVCSTGSVLGDATVSCCEAPTEEQGSVLVISAADGGCHSPC